ncbi:siderophore-interacting protein [Nocardia aurantia]|uniref:Iron import ATP-binding/permease protein IrtA n=1 Tax=Nocardia aurantia TaxID=2585199 RepID=A0A7K0DGH2_9NOCA|nr:siderophore-interacting protein [Nocardia aurantia]MQY24916.1 Iron import ATP-binding/permease protein IrtA [Nocardia aurantia]
MGKGYNGFVLKMMRAKDYRLTVSSTEALTDKYVRLGFAGGGLLKDHPVHPTQFVRMWIPEEGSETLHHRGYTIIDQDPDGDRFWIEFALHDGPAANWARAAAVGDQVECTVMGSDFTLPDPLPAEFLIFGDTASLPAVNSLLDAIGDIPARIWLEWQYESDTTLPVRTGPKDQLTWVQRVDDGRLMRELARDIDCPKDAFVWAACDAFTTRSIAKTLQTTHELPKSAVKARGYWK